MRAKMSVRAKVKVKRIGVGDVAAPEAQGRVDMHGSHHKSLCHDLLPRPPRLAPQIRALRTLRTEFQELESEYLEKKAVYDNQAAGLESEVAKMQAEMSLSATRDNCAQTS